MSDSSLFISSAIPWLRRIDEDGAREIFDRLDNIISGRERPRELTMRGDYVFFAEDRITMAAAEPLCRWDRRSPYEIFRDGFWPRVAPGSMEDFRETDDISLHLHRYINDHVRSVFVSTTRPVRTRRDGPIEFWRPPVIDRRFCYELFAYGGVDVSATFNYNRDVRYPEQVEIAFIGGIRPGLIRSATEYDERGRILNVWRNVHFNPLLLGDHAPRAQDLPDFPEFSNPITFRFLDPDGHDNDDDGGHHGHDELRRRDTIEGDDSEERNGDFSDYKLEPDPWFADNLHKSRLARACMLIPEETKAYFFADTRFVTIDLTADPNPTNAIGEEGVQSVVSAWPAWHEAEFPYVDAVFPNPNNYDEAYFFCEDKYALVDIKTRKLVSKAKVIVEEWPSLKEAGFSTIDAIFPLNDRGEAYFFRGQKYAHVKVKPGTNDDYLIGPVRPISGNWPVLRHVGFDTVDAVLPSPRGTYEAYFFNGTDYVGMRVVPGTTDDEMLSDRCPVKAHWPSLVKAKFY